MSRIAFYDVNSDGSLSPEIGTVELTPEGLIYSDDRVRGIMAGWVNRFGEEKAFSRFSNWSNGYRASRLTP